MTTINNTGNINPILPQNITDVTTAKNKDAGAAPAGNIVLPAADKVEISRQAKVISKAAVALNELPEVRTDLVTKAAQERTASDNRIPANLLAQKMLFQDIK
jgi:hypothetical protein